MKITRFFSAITACAAALCAVGCSSGEPEKPILRIGCNFGYPPFEYYSENKEQIGIDIELGKALAEKMGMKAQIVETAWEGILEGLNKDNYDCVISAVTITDGRTEKFDFSDPYITNYQCIMTLKDAEFKPTSPEETAGLKIGVQDETTSDVFIKDFAAMVAKYDGEPDTSAYGVWVPGIPVLVESGLDAVGCADWLKGLILDGIVAGVGAVLGFVPQMLVLFIFLAFLEACGYMARIAFVLDRVFRKFGLSGKSFIPILIGTGCGIPGIMASRTIENERDRRMTIMTTTFIPCGAKTPFIAMIAGAIFGGSPWISTGAYFIGIAAIIISGIILKKTKMFAGDPAPFVMELPAYHIPTVGNVLRSMWERGWSFIKKAGTIILLSTILVWFTSYFGFVDGSFTMLEEDQMEYSILAAVGSAICWIFAPLGWGNWQATVAAITGLVAKENIVGTLGVLYGGGDQSVYAAMGAAFTSVSGMSFLIFNLLCAPCFAAMGAIKREMNNTRWFWIAIGYECGFAYAAALVVNSFGNLFAGTVDGVLGVICLIVSVVILGFAVYMLAKPYKESSKLTKTVRVK